LKLGNDDVSTLERLGFSPNQAKVYFALVMLGTASAKDIWNFSGVSREEVYRKLRELQKLGFVELIFAKPAKFRATPLECVSMEMLRRKAEEISKLQTETEELLRKVHVHKRENLQAETPYIRLIPQKRAILERTKEELEGLRICLDTICSWEKGIGWMSSHQDLFVDVLNRNVTIRFLIGNSEGYRFPRFVEELQKNPYFQIKAVQALPPAFIGLYDQKILFVDTLAKTTFLESPVFWSTNPCIVGMAQIYFESVWSNSLE